MAHLSSYRLKYRSILRTEARRYGPVALFYNAKPDRRQMFCQGIHCPHYNTGTLGLPRRKDFQAMIGKIGRFGIAIEDNCAIAFMDGKYYKVIASKPRAGAYRVYKKGRQIKSERIKQQPDLVPIAELYRQN